jgi:photoactive yellow protein
MEFAEQIANADLISTEALGLQDPGEHVRRNIDSLTDEEFDRLPFGAIQLDTEGRILRYNEFESSLSGVGKAGAVGKHFFTEIAPCCDVREFHGRFKEGVARKQMHEKFRYRFAFRRNPCDVTVTLFYSEITDSVWVFVRPA